MGLVLPRPVVAWGVWVVGEVIRAVGVLLWGVGWIPLSPRVLKNKGQKKFLPPEGLRHAGRWLASFPVGEMVFASLTGDFGVAVVSRQGHLVLGGPLKKSPQKKGGSIMEEKRKILEMVASGKITPEEGVRLLEALDAQKKQPVASSPKGKTLLVEVHDLEGDNHVLVRLPVSLIRWAVKAGISFKAFAAGQVEDPEVRAQVEQAFEALETLDLDRLVEEVRELGELVRVDSEEARVSIRIE